MEEKNLQRESEELRREEDKVTLAPPPPPPPPPPPSSATSPSHEFSFTITLQPASFHPSPTSTIRPWSKPAPALDLAPADDIFFHGHLLPLHLLSDHNAPPRRSDVCIENFSLPLERVRLNSDVNYLTERVDSDRLKYHHAGDHHQHGKVLVNGSGKDRIKNKSFFFHFGFGKLRKGRDNGEKEVDDKKRKKKMFDMSRFMKKYVSMMETIFFFKNAEKAKHDLRRRPYSFSGHSNRKESVDGWRRKKGQFSAPASMRTSPTNSGLLVATPVAYSSSDNSTMEELQNAIQAAIAHCKNSSAMKEDKCKC